MSSFRIYHLLLGAAVAAAYFTSESTGVPHAWIGYGVAALVMLRLALGLAGKAGFGWQRLRLRRAGHNAGRTVLTHPLVGRALTLALLLGIATAAGTGIAMDRGGTLVGQSIRAHESDEQEHREADKHDESLLAEVHETVGNALLPLAIAHLLWMLIARRDLALFLLFWPKRRRSPAAVTASS